MRAIHRFIGCALCLAGMGSAAAASPDAQTIDSSPHAAIDGTNPHDGGGSGGDAAGLNRDCAPAASSDSSSSISSSGNDRSGDATSIPMPNHRPHLGWQSLLPGSIQ
ncbi:hypothetical protein ACPPVV_16270 [Rhodanobacter sp. Col0626]|uniref:hypothetical protein n=1 Tax=Rhodanobacter sp. Col0626 TaxID=3415679 RepID=UPI003CE7D1F7